MAVSAGKIVWDESGKKYFETGVRNCVLYTLQDDGGTDKWLGVAWNGITSISESPEGADLTDLYADDIKYASLRANETFGGTIEAYTYPDEFALCDGTASPVNGVYLGQQGRKKLALCYRTAVGSDTLDDLDSAYKLHIIYGCSASPSEKSYETINDSPDAITFSWEFSSDPVNCAGYRPVSSIVIDSRTATAGNLTTLENLLYGTNATKPELPMPNTVITTMGGSVSVG